MEIISTTHLSHLQHNALLDSEKQLNQLHSDKVTSIDQFNFEFKKVIYPFIDSTKSDHTEFFNKSKQDSLQFNCKFSKDKLICRLSKNDKVIQYVYNFKNSQLKINKKVVPFKNYKLFCDHITIILKKIAAHKSLYRELEH
ncbi:hypothetical protein DID75_04380 [Candidatus Marinamargulisbacteria bacterium SCGC AG-410-N11]|nr:hypothetical protein DID75_04380 [Candidatus Marinamargulisbacteria bacterium SCGC AG-410-N11]